MIFNYLAPNVAAVGAAIEQIFPLVYEFRKKRSPEDEQALLAKKRKGARRYRDDFVVDTETLMVEDRMLTDEEPEDEEMQAESDASWD